MNQAQPPPIPSELPPIPPAYGPPQRSGGGLPWVFWVGGGCLTLLVLAGLGGYFAFKGVFGMLEKSPPYQDGLARAQQSSEVRQALGAPVETDGMMSGHINKNNDTGDADFTIPLKGTKNKGVLHIVSEKESGQNWAPQVLEVTVEAGPPINLLNDSEEVLEKQP